MAEHSQAIHKAPTTVTFDFIAASASTASFTVASAAGHLNNDDLLTDALMQVGGGTTL